ncbi:ABC transporter permease subunit [Streptomyces sp. RB6PN25]|uniref:ABC transporter permease subunit n=1 Tax=Streptomyces humicola TaxID=2953240 RepID=A0ABT1PRR8_9ACTN|nr:ABC transporter permease subunit [Streptomyces humicola]MCQ4080364.1 ABC transporter permease subunit [Streptomyces humicola]
MARLIPSIPSIPSRRPRFGRGAVLAVSAAYFAVPLLAAVVYTVDDPVKGVTLSAYTGILGAGGFLPALLLSLELAAATIAVVLLILVPAAIAVRLGGSRLRAAVEVVCTLPLVVPPIALAAGLTTVLKWGPEYLARTPFFQTIVALQNPGFPVVLVLAYVVMSLPLAYRALDAGLRTLDVPTLMEAALNNGAGRIRAVTGVILPNLRGALLNAVFLTLALVLGEYTVASILGFQPFTVWIVNGSASAQGPVTIAVSVLSLLLTWALLLVLSASGGRRHTSAPASRNTKGTT